MCLHSLLLNRKQRLGKICNEKYSTYQKVNSKFMEHMEQCMKEYEQCSDVDDNLLNLFKAYKSSSGEFNKECKKIRTHKTK
jgi:hypothetical protein